MCLSTSDSLLKFMPTLRIFGGTEKLCVKEESVIAEILGFDDEPYSQARMEFVIVE